MPTNAPIIIKESNCERIETWLQRERPRAQVRTLGFADLAALCPQLESRLDPLSLVERPGASATVRAGEVVSWSYTGAEEDQIHLERRPGGWAVASLERVRCGTGLAYTRRSKIVRVVLTPTQFYSWAGRLAGQRDLEVWDPEDPVRPGRPRS